MLDYDWDTVSADEQEFYELCRQRYRGIVEEPANHDAVQFCRELKRQRQCPADCPGLDAADRYGLCGDDVEKRWEENYENRRKHYYVQR